MRKKREKRHQALFAILLVIAMLTGMVPAELASVKAKEAKAPAFTKENKVSDPSTMNGWKKWQENGGKVTTNNVGRIWTDKSVYTDSVTANGKKVEIGQSDFLVSLSALSSTANLTTLTSMPLDIVLVLDASGSMDETLGNQVTYQEAYKLSKFKKYYIKEQGSYRAVQYSTLRRYWYRVDNWARVEPKESAQDSDPSHVQFYIRKDVSKMDALHTAVNNFLDATAAENQKIDDVKKQHRVSVVKFASELTDKVGNDINRSGYNYSQIVTNLAAITEENKESIKGIVNSIQPGGATRADNGMQRASDALKYGDKTTSQKVVIFFTDGEPTSMNQFEPAVAKEAIEFSYNLKNNSTDPVIVYGIGMLDGANPDDIDHPVNGFLNGISSNYPKARNYLKTKLGTRVEAEKQYYYAANDADKLNQIFQNIFEEISQVSAGAPTEVKGGNHRNSGYITFHEVVGDYMHVDGFQSIVVGDTCFEKVHKIENSDKDTYVFEGTWKNANGKNANVEDIIIQVSHVQDVRSGDEITVKIPASCIPQSVYDIDKEENLTVNYAQPLSVFYTVSLKPEVEGLLKNPDPAMKQYIESHKNKEGSVEFYSSLFSKNNENGFTTATFTPALQNAFYRFTENTPMYANPDCQERIQNSLFAPNKYSYWYLRSCFEQDASGKASEKESKIEVKSVPDDSSVLTAERGRYVGLDSEKYVFVKAGAPRLQRNNQDMFAVKTENKTGTVKTSNDPKWDQNEKIAVYLGNNGKLSVQIPGTLAVKKVATIAEGSTGPVDQKGTSTLNDQVFSFEIAASALANKTYAVEVMDADGNVVSGSDMKLQFDANGLSSFTLKNNQTLLLDGLPSGTAYEVKETTMPAGFSELKEKTQNAKGTIESGKVVEAEFHNEYKAKETIPSAENQLYVKKNFLNSEGKDAWNSVEKGTKFKARLSAAEYPSGVNEEKLFPQGAVIEHDEATPYITKELTSKEQVSFGEMTFDHVGKYVYIISEEIPAEPILGVTYSGEKYRVEIEVVDDGAGQLRVASNKMSALDANGEAVPLEHAVATITNEYNLSEGSATLEAKKVFHDTTGTQPLKENMFTFAIRPLTEGAPVPQYQENQGWKAFEALDTQKSDAYKATNYANGDILFGTIRFDESKIVGGQPTTYVYECWEINEAKKGVTYDENHYYAHVTVSSAKDENGTACVKVETTWKTGPDKTDADVTLAEGETGPQFKNSYRAEKVEINPATTAGLVKKVLEGNRKEALQEDEFTFEMKVEAVGESKLDTITFPEGAKDGIVFAKNKVDGSIDFGKLGFDEAGQYQVTIREVKPEKADPNMSYDDHTFCYELQVVNNPKTGALEVFVVDGTTKGASTFTNIYTKEKEKGSLTLSKEVKVKEEQGITVNPEQKFTFQVEFKDQDGKELQDAYSIQDGKTIKSGDAVQLKHSQSVTITGLPEGTSYVVTETEIPAGYQAKETVLKGTIVGGKEAKAHFINTYGVGEVVLSGEAGIKVQKKLVGREWRDGDAFTFDISLVGGDANGIKLPESLKVTDGAIAEFGAITCKKPGVYEVLVTENRENPIAGITYATGSAKVTLTVTDKGDGSMGVQSELQSAITAFALTNGGIEVKDGVIIFTNEYTPEKVVASIEGKKLMSGRELQPEDLFTFEIFAKEDAPLPAITKVQNDATGKFAFPAIAYEKEGTYAYTVKETGGTRPGVVNSREEVPVTVVVSYDQKKGVLKANVNYPEQGLIFTNSYQASSVVPAEFAQGIQGKKLVTASEGNAYTMQGGEFTFKLIPDIHNPKSDPIKETVVKNQADGSIVFVNGSVEYKEAGTYLYTLKEVDQSIPGITNDGAPIVIKVVVTDNQETGKLEASVSYTKANKDVAEIVFENKYDPASVGVVIAGTKKLTGKALEEQAFQFVLEAEQGEGEDAFEAPMPNADTSVRNDAAGNFAFGEIQYQKPGTYVYKVYEVNEQKEGYTYDSTTHTVTVVVTDADGKLQAAVSTDGAEGAKPVFQNSYQAAPVVLEGAKALKAKKVLEGRELQAGEFEFELKDKENQIVATGKNDADGTITFGSLKFEKEGTYYYVMSEKQNGIGGITYDESEVAVEIHVKDANGHLEAEVRYLDDGEETKLPVFTNTYQAEAVRVVLGASKELIGRELKASEFTFLLKDEDGKVVAKGYNDLYGVILFENLVFDQAGTYVYTICEEKGHEKDIVYDEAVYSYTIIVEDTKEGSFKVTVNTDGKPIVFTNQYKKPASPKPEKPESPKPETQKPKPQKPAKPSAPKTGDEAPIVGMVVVMILAAAAIVGVIVYNIRRRKRK